MRFIALAFGVVAGLVASLVLALGGLDLELLALDQKQLAGFRFGLFVVANLGVFGAGLVLGAPIAAATLFALGAVGWIIAAMLLRHGPDLVMIVPPGLLIVAGVLSLIAGLRRPAPALPPLNYVEDRQAARRMQPDDEDADLDTPPEPVPESYDELPPIAVGAGFFGEGGTAMPLGASAASIGSNVGELDDDPPRRGMDDWRPGRKRPPPPRTKPAFKEIDDEFSDDGESGFSRFARGASTLLSFGLYAALAGAAILVFLNLHTGNSGRPTVAPVDASSSPSTSPEIAAARASSRAEAAASTADASSAPSSDAVLPTASSLPPLTSAGASSALATLDGAPGVITADISDVLVSPAASEAPAASSEAPADAPSSSEEPLAASEEPAIADTPEPAAIPAESGQVMPWPVPAQLAAERLKPAPRRPAQAAPAATPAVNTTGL